MILSSLLIICIIYPPYISTAFVKSPFNFATGLNPSNPRPLHINPTPDPSSESTIQATLPSTMAQANATSSPAIATASSPPDITLNNTVLENPTLLEEVPESTLLDEDNAVLANNTSISVQYATYCWSAPRIHSIQNPDDCTDALRVLFREGSALMPVKWSEAESWIWGSCALLLVPNRETVEDVFLRLDIVYAVTAIQQQCVNEASAFRGGHRGIGPLDNFHVSVEASNMNF